MPYRGPSSKTPRPPYYSAAPPAQPVVYAQAPQPQHPVKIWLQLAGRHEDQAEELHVSPECTISHLKQEIASSKLFVQVQNRCDIQDITLLGKVIKTKIALKYLPELSRNVLFIRLAPEHSTDEVEPSERRRRPRSPSPEILPRRPRSRSPPRYLPRPRLAPPAEFRVTLNGNPPPEPRIPSPEPEISRPRVEAVVPRNPVPERKPKEIRTMAVAAPMPPRKKITVIPRKSTPSVVKATKPASQNVCRQFIQGRCRWGAECWDLHTSTEAAPKIVTLKRR